MSIERLVVLGLCFVLASCERKPPLQIPDTATVHVTTKRLEHLEHFDGVPALDRFDRGAPGWLFCDSGACAVGGKPSAASEEPLDGGEEIHVWASDPEVKTAALEKWSSHTGAKLDRAHRSDAMMKGRITPGVALSRIDFKNPRARELLDRVTHQTGAVLFEADFVEDELRATLQLARKPGEPRFVAELGPADGIVPPLGGLIDPGVVGVIRASANPAGLWALVRSALAAPARVGLDAFVAALREEFSLDIETDLLGNLTGHFVIVAYSVEPSAAAGAWLDGSASREAIYIGLRNPETIRRILDASTQLSRGKLNTQRVDGERTQWAWIDDGEVRWTIILGPDYALVVDSPVAFEHARQFETRPAPIDASLDARGLPKLLEERRRSGVYLDAPVLGAFLGNEKENAAQRFRWVTIIADESSGDELVEVRVGGFKKD